MVAPSHQRNGVANNLVRLAEEKARNANRTIVTLDTSSNVMAAISKQLGYTLYGTIPEFVETPKGELVDTHFFYKKL